MIELQQATVRYGGHPAIVALDWVRLGLAPGVTLVRGAGGAGKSTLLRALATLQPLSEGSIRYPWGSASPAGLPRIRARIGYVPQENRLTQGLTVEQALRYLAAVRGLAGGSPAVASLLERWGLAPARAKRLCELSSGEGRRWLLAQSRLGDPELWLLDEPLRSLDADGVQTLRAELALYIRPATATPRYAVAVAHDGRLDDLATSIVHLDRGRIVAP